MPTFRFEPNSRPHLVDSLTLYAAPEGTRAGGGESFSRHLQPPHSPSVATSPTAPPAPKPPEPPRPPNSSPTRESNRAAGQPGARPAASHSNSSTNPSATESRTQPSAAAPESAADPESATASEEPIAEGGNATAATPEQASAEQNSTPASDAAGDAAKSGVETAAAVGEATAQELATELAQRTTKPDAIQGKAESKKSSRQRAAEIAAPGSTAAKRGRPTAKSEEPAESTSTHPSTAITKTRRGTRDTRRPSEADSPDQEKENALQAGTHAAMSVGTSGVVTPVPEVAKANSEVAGSATEIDRSAVSATELANATDAAAGQQTSTSEGAPPEALAALAALTTLAAANQPANTNHETSRSVGPNQERGKGAKALETLDGTLPSGTTVPATATDPLAEDKLAEATAATLLERESGSRGSSTPTGPNGPTIGSANTPTPAKFAQHLAAKGAERPSRGPGITEAEQARLVDRVAKAFLAAEARGGAVTLRLHPPELGVLRVELKLQDGVLSARLEAESPAAQSVLLDNSQILRDRLAEQGVRVERFDVDLMDRRPSDNSSNFDQQSPFSESESRRTRTPDRLRSDSPETESPRSAPRVATPGQLNVII